MVKKEQALIPHWVTFQVWFESKCTVGQKGRDIDSEFVYIKSFSNLNFVLMGTSIDSALVYIPSAV